MASHRGLVYALKTLVSHGANVNMACGGGVPVFLFFQLTITTRSLPCAMLLRDAGFNLSFFIMSWFSYYMVQWLVRLGADPAMSYDGANIAIVYYA